MFLVVSFLCVSTRVNFYESSVEQLKKELPKYLQQQSGLFSSLLFFFTSMIAVVFLVLNSLELEKSHQSVSKMIKSVASSEPHNLLQYFLFSYSGKEEELATLTQACYTEVIPKTKAMLDEWTKKLILPIRVRTFLLLALWMLS
jgi:hypothetical protein